MTPSKRGSRRGGEEEGACVCVEMEEKEKEVEEEVKEGEGKKGGRRAKMGR